MSCRMISVAESCNKTSNPNETLALHYVYDDKGKVTHYYHMDRNGSVVDTTTNFITVGKCRDNDLKVQYIVLCDIQTDGSSTQFMARITTSVNSISAIQSTGIEYFTMDLSATYTPTGTIGLCGEVDSCEDQTFVGVINTLNDLD